MIIGAGTYRAFEAVERLIAAGASADRIRIHLGHNKLSGGKKNPFHRYHPMLHSKIYYFDFDDGHAAAFVGSHNVTGFALRGLNGEAGILAEGSANDPFFAAVRAHVAEAYRQAANYDPTLKEAFAWWAKEYFDGLSAEANDAPRDSEARSTIVILAALAGPALPKAGDIVYFELSEALREIRSLGTEVHLHLFQNLPPSPADALIRLDEAEALLCGTVGLESGRGGIEFDADWSIGNGRHPVLEATVRPFRPRTSAGMQQVRVDVKRPLGDRFSYLFDIEKASWSPLLAPDDPNQRTDPLTREIWQPVRGLVPKITGDGAAPYRALIESSPSSGSFILHSRRRRRRDRPSD